MFSLIKKKNYTKNTKSKEEYSLEGLKPEERDGVVVEHRALNRVHLGSIPTAGTVFGH